MASLFETQGYEDKMHSPTRELKIAPKPGKKGKPGLVDPGLFTGETNHLYIIMDEYGNWAFKFQNGILPEPLRAKFTRASKAITHAKQYFDKRDLEVTEVIDIHAT